MEDLAVAGDVVVWRAGCVGPYPGPDGVSGGERSTGVAVVVVEAEVLSKVGVVDVEVRGALGLG